MAESQAAMMRGVIKMLTFVSMEPNIITDSDGTEVKVYRHSFQMKKQYYFFCITRIDGIALPMMPSHGNASYWEEDCALKRLIAGSRTHSLAIYMTLEPEAKRPKEAEVVAPGIETTINAEALMQSNSPISSWWESGDARRLFAPCTVNYVSTECIKGIVMDQIELLESINRKGKNWTIMWSQGRGTWRHVPTPNQIY